MQAGSSSEDENDFAIPETARVHKPGETFSDDSDVDKQDDEESDEDDGDNENDDAVPLTARVHKPGESFSDGSSEEDSDSERNTAAPTDQVIKWYLRSIFPPPSCKGRGSLPPKKLSIFQQSPSMGIQRE